jgi:hypothetical protein
MKPTRGLDLAVQYLIGGKTDGVQVILCLQVLVKPRLGERRISPKEAADVQVAVASDDRFQN